MKPVLVLRHNDECPVGLLGDALSAAGLEWSEVMLPEGEPIPSLGDYSALVVLGGSMGAYQESEHPWLLEEKQAVAAAHADDMPMLGLCLGAQLFADALGGSAYLADSLPEIAHMAPELTAVGVSDPVLREFDTPVVVFHQDTWDPPPGADVLATSDRFDHAFRLGSAVAIQAHPEADTEIVRSWLTMPEEIPLIRRSGVDPSELLAEVEAGEPAQRRMSARLFGAWVQEVLQTAAPDAN